MTYRTIQPTQTYSSHSLHRAEALELGNLNRLTYSVVSQECLTPDSESVATVRDDDAKSTTEAQVCAGNGGNGGSLHARGGT